MYLDWSNFANKQKCSDCRKNFISHFVKIRGNDGQALFVQLFGAIGSVTGDALALGGLAGQGFRVEDHAVALLAALHGEVEHVEDVAGIRMSLNRVFRVDFLRQIKG